MQIHQLSVTYQAEHDRLLLKVNSVSNEEMRMWLTRRLMSGLWPLMTRLNTEQLIKMEAAGSALAAADDELKKMVTEFRKEEFLQGADFDTPYQEKPTLPLGTEPLVVTDVDATPLGNGRLRLAFNERATVSGGEKPRGFQLELDPKLTQGLLHLLEQAIARSGWRDAFAASPAATEAAEPGASGERPRYLN